VCGQKILPTRAPTGLEPTGAIADFGLGVGNFTPADLILYTDIRSGSLH
jgi:hypothetical protein